jgi:oligopeptide transport system ATP-binding protein
MTDDVIVMYAGRVFERAPTVELFERPANPYTRGLLMSVPDPTAADETLYQIPGLPPDPAHLPQGCPFAPRCDRVQDICLREFPPIVHVAPQRQSLCHFAKEVYEQSAPLRT